MLETRAGAAYDSAAPRNRTIAEKGVTKMGHKRRFLRRVALIGAALASVATPALTEPAANDYPTIARVEYVVDCMRTTGPAEENVYKCACVIDRIAEKLKYDDYVEASTFSKYAATAGERGGVFRDPDEARQKAKLYREVETGAFKSCAIAKPPRY